jgi:hypothetical protein
MTAATNRDGSASSAMSLVKPRFRVKGISTEPAAWLSELIVLDAEDRRRIPDHAGTQKLSLVPKEAMLLHNYPNPFNPFTTIRYGIPEDARVTIAIYNILGQRLTVLLDCPQVAGYHVVTWDGRDPQGRKMASGIYLYQMKTGRLSLVEKMVLVK